MSDFDAIVLAGGRGTRLGGVDKAAILLGRSTLLDRALAAVDSARTIAVVGPRRVSKMRGAMQVTEAPPFAGPAAAINAGIRALDRTDGPSPMTVVLAADLPAAVPAVRAVLRSVDPGADRDGWVGTDPAGRRQYLLAVYRTDALAAACSVVTASRGSLANASVRQLVQSLRLVDVPLAAALTADVDTPADLAAAAEREKEHGVVPT